MNPTIRQILALSGEMPDAAAHVRYLQTLDPQQLSARAAALVNDRSRQRAPDRTPEFWRRMKSAEVPA